VARLACGSIVAPCAAGVGGVSTGGVGGTAAVGPRWIRAGASVATLNRARPRGEKQGCPKQGQHTGKPAEPTRRSATAFRRVSNHAHLPSPVEAAIPADVRPPRLSSQGDDLTQHASHGNYSRSEERRVGKEGRT